MSVFRCAAHDRDENTNVVGYNLTTKGEECCDDGFDPETHGLNWEATDAAKAGYPKPEDWDATAPET